MSRLAIQMPSGKVHWAELIERDGSFTHTALCGLVEHGYSVFRGVTCQRCIAIANDDRVSLARMDAAEKGSAA